MKRNNLEEKEKREKKFEMIAKIIMLILVILVFIFFVYPGILLKNIKENKSNKSNQYTVVQNNIQKDENNFIEFSEGILNNTNFIIGKKSDNKWYEIKSSDNKIKLIGNYENKLYYYDENGISYIKIYESDLTDKQWLKYKKYEISDTSETGNMEIEKAIMIEDTIYFSYSLNSTGTIETDGILSIKVSDTSLDNAIQILSNANNFYWDIDLNNKEIYYLEDDENLKKYNIQENSTESLLNDIESFKLYKNEEILYFNLNQNSKEESVSEISLATYDLYMYNIKTQENKMILSYSVSDIDASDLWQLVDYQNDDAYYINDNNIIKYNNGVNEVICSYLSENSNDLEGFSFINENIIELYIQNENKKYFINGTLTDNITNNYGTTVKTKDGEEKQIII